MVRCIRQCQSCKRRFIGQSTSKNRKCNTCSTAKAVTNDNSISESNNGGGVASGQALSSRNEVGPIESQPMAKRAKLDTETEQDMPSSLLNNGPREETALASVNDTDAGEEDYSSSCCEDGSEGGDDFYCTQLQPDEESEVEEESEEEADEEIHGTINDDDDLKLENGGNQSSLAISSVISVARLGKKNTKNDEICFICGSSFSRITSGLKGRLNHIKRCAKKHGVTAHEIRVNDDSDAFTTQQVAAHSTSTSMTKTNSGNENNKKSAAGIVNPYLKTPDQNNYKVSEVPKWHADAAQDLSLADATTVDTMPVVASYSVGQKGDNKPAVSQKTKQTSLTNFIQVPLRSLNNVLLTNAKRIAKTGEINTNKKQQQQQQGTGSNGKRGRWGRQRQEYAKRKCPAYKRITGSDFVCDGFMYARSTLTTKYFLSHFHSDHYGGIDSSWNAGVIYCSLVTANLVHQQLGVSKEYLHPLGLNTPTVIESNGRPIHVTLIDANHCPGAVMFLFQVGKRNILHVGDFRWNKSVMLSSPPIKSLSVQQPQLDEIFLDTTYCDEKYCLPSQEVAIKAAVEVAKKEVQESKQKKENLLFLFGAYTIGKERMFLSVAEALGSKVYVDTQRYRILSALEWPDERLAMLTTKKDESNIWIVPMGHLNMKKMPEYLTGLSKAKNPVRTFDRVVGFRPTGWSNTTGNSIVTTRRSGTKLAVHSVPYSEHSSFPELLECIQTLKPKKIIPTVSVSKSEQQVNLLLRCLKMRQRLIIGQE